jgi:hypothetical protein
MTPTNKKLIAAALAGLVLAPGVALRAADDAPDAKPQAAASRDSASTGAPNTLSEREKKAGFKLLFDGKTTDGWRSYKQQQISDKWQAVDGALTRAEKGAGDIITKDQYSAFELLIDWKISPGGNSGIMFHVTEEGDTPWMTGPEIQVQDNKGGHDPQLAGWLYQLYQPPKDPKTGKPVDATKPAGEWNSMRILIAPPGQKSEIYMNGVKYAEFVKGSDDWNQRVAKSKFGQMKNFGKPTRGYISLQDHGDDVAFRNIKIRVIDSSASAR